MLRIFSTMSNLLWPLLSAADIFNSLLLSDAAATLYVALISYLNILIPQIVKLVLHNNIPKLSIEYDNLKNSRLDLTKSKRTDGSPHTPLAMR